MKARRRSASLVGMLAGAGLAPLAAGCRAPDDDLRGPTPVADEAPAAAAQADDARLPHGPLGSFEDARLARIDARLLDLQGSINKLDLDGADRSECESRWEELDTRRAAVRRARQALPAAPGSELDERRRALAADLDQLESDLEAAILEVESRLSRG